MTTARARRFAKLARIEQWRSKFTYSVVAPTTFRGLVAETLNAFRELVTR